MQPYFVTKQSNGVLALSVSETKSIYLTRRESAAYLKSRYRVGSKAQLDIVAMTPGAGPKFVKNGHLALYTIEDLDSWMASRLKAVA